MSTFAIGDIHGNDAALADLLAQLSPLIEPADTVVFLGDYIDRGPSSKQCIQRILDFRAAVPGAVVALLSNHEDALLDTRHSFNEHTWLIAMDAWPTIESYSSHAAEVLRAAKRRAGGRLYSQDYQLPYDVLFDAMPGEHLRFFEELQPYHRTADALCVHAGLDPGRGPVEQQLPKMLLWGNYRFVDHYHGPETIAYGHYSNAVLDSDGWPGPLIQEHSVGVDTSKHGVLTAIRLPERRVFQSGRYGDAPENG